MTINTLKKLVETNKLTDSILIFIIDDKKGSNKKFLANQYISAIANNKNKSVEHIDSFEKPESDELFGTIESIESQNYRVFETDVLEVKDIDILQEPYLIIVTKEVKKDKNLDSTALEILDKQTVVMPDVESWQICDYILSKSEGLNIETAQWFANLYNNDLYRIDAELTKLSIFTESEQMSLMQEFKKENIFEELPQITIFNISNALVTQRVSDLASIYKYKNLLIKPNEGEIGFISLLFKTFKNLIMVKTSRNPVPEVLGMSDKQVYAIKRLPMVYTQSQLLKIFDIVSDADRQVKNGEIDAKYIVDYLIIKILTI